jgi:hypothetical protein
MWGSTLTRSQTDESRRNPWHNETEGHQDPIEEASSPDESSGSRNAEGRDYVGGDVGRTRCGSPGHSHGIGRVRGFEEGTVIHITNQVARSIRTTEYRPGKDNQPKEHA